MKLEGWTRAKIEQVTKFVGRGTAPKYASVPTHFVAISQKCVRGGCVDPTLGRHHEANQPVKPDSILQVGDVCLNSTGTGTIGRAGLWTAPADGRTYFADTHVTIIRPERQRLEPKLLAEVLLDPLMQRRLESECFSGSTNQVELNRSALVALELLLPPLPEQRKIAAILSSVDEAIEATQAVIDQLQVVKKAMMAELLTRGLPGRHTRFKMTEIGEVPEGWDIKPCGSLFDIQLGKMMSQQARDGENQFPYLRNENVYWQRLDLSCISTMHFDRNEREKFRLRVGDLLACEGRHIGRCAMWQGQLDECYFQKALHRIRGKTDLLTTSYMQYFMMLRFRYMSDLVAEANATSTIPHLPRERLLVLPVWFPPRNEQDEIVGALDALTTKEREEEAVLNAARNLKFALMSVLLTGEARVKPDPEVP